MTQLIPMHLDQHPFCEQHTEEEDECQEEIPVRGRRGSFSQSIEHGKKVAAEATMLAEQTEEEEEEDEYEEDIPVRGRRGSFSESIEHATKVAAEATMLAEQLRVEDSVEVVPAKASTQCCNRKVSGHAACPAPGCGRVWN